MRGTQPANTAGFTPIANVGGNRLGVEEEKMIGEKSMAAMCVAPSRLTPLGSLPFQRGAIVVVEEEMSANATSKQRHGENLSVKYIW